MRQVDGDRRAGRLQPQTQNWKSRTAKGAPRTQIFSGACRSLMRRGCYLDVHVRDKQVVRTTAEPFRGTAEFDRICPRGTLAACARIRL